MLTKESLSFLRKLKIVRGISLPISYLPGTNRLPRYRVQIPPDAQDLLVGQTLADTYYVLSVLGFGGMSVVYKAKRLNKQRIFAVKTLRLQSLSDERTLKRFQREAELLSHLNHPRIVQVSYYGTTKRGQPYFVMDYLTGENLTSVFKNEGPMSPERVRDIFSQVCGAVDHAHRCGVVHRDLKPGNIMLMEEEGQKDFVKVVDFGIARFEEEAQRLTRMGEVWGSPVYMSPEQCMGAQLDVRSDIYSIGVVMYEALTGRVPHLGKNYVETMSMQIMNYPRAFSEVCPGRSFPPGLEKVVRKALEKEPDKRYQTMGELRSDLEVVVPRAGEEPTFGRSDQRVTGRSIPGLPQSVVKLFDQAINPSRKNKVIKGPADVSNLEDGQPPGSDFATGRSSSANNAVVRAPSAKNPSGRTSAANNPAFGGRSSSANNQAYGGRSSSPDNQAFGGGSSIDRSSSANNPSFQGRSSSANNPGFASRTSAANNPAYGRTSSGRNQSYRDSQWRIKQLQAKNSQSISFVIMVFAFAAMTVALIALATQLLGGLKGSAQLKLLPGEEMSDTSNPDHSNGLSTFDQFPNGRNSNQSPGLTPDGSPGLTAPNPPGGLTGADQSSNPKPSALPHNPESTLDAPHADKGHSN